MRSNTSDEGNSATVILSTAGYGTAGDGTAGIEDRTAAPAVGLVVVTGVIGAGAAGTGTVFFCTLEANLFSGACLVGAGPFYGSSAQSFQVPEAYKWVLCFLLDFPFGIF